MKLVGVPSINVKSVNNPSGIGYTCEWRIINGGDFEKMTNTEGEIYFQSIIN